MSAQQDVLSVEMVVEATGGILVQGDAQASFSGVSTDSRSIRTGELFFALHGDKFDGHRFITEAVEKGGRGVVVKEEIRCITDEAISMIQVPDTLRALGDLANLWRKRHPIPLVAIVGSNGKTTTKEMVAAIIGKRYTVLKNPGNFNNLIGLPLTLLKMNTQDQVVVLEMGMNCKGEIGRLAHIAEPDLGVMINIGPVHLEGLGSIEGVMEAKGELIEVMGEDQRLVFNADDPRVVELSKRFRGATTSFGIKNPADWAATDINTMEDGMISFQVHGPMGVLSISLKLMGGHQVYNALASAAVASHLGVGAEEVKEGLRTIQSPPMRMELITVGEGIKIINDAYNANPTSMESALRTLGDVRGERKIAVLGDMAELGDYTQQAHREIGRWVKNRGVEFLFLVGEFAPYVVQGATEAGMDGKTIIVGKDHQELVHYLSRFLRRGDWVLIKGSRIMQMEKIIEGLKEAV